MKKRIGIVVQRFGLEARGGAELLARLLAKALVEKYEVEVITTKAVSHNTWQNEYKNDIEVWEGVVIRRFGVARVRVMSEFQEFVHTYESKTHKTLKDDYEYLVRQGPYCPDMFEYIRREKDNYDLFLVVTYDFIHSFEAITAVGNKSVFIPTAHDEVGFRRGTVAKIMKYCGGLIYLTRAEKKFVESVYPKVKEKMSVTTGIFLDRELANKNEVVGCKVGEYLKKKRLYMVYMGRIEASKGCNELFDYYGRYSISSGKESIDLVLMGPEILPVPRLPGIVYLGVVNDKEKYEVMKRSLMVVNSSLYESFSFVICEAWEMKRPVLVNGRCAVLKDQVRLADGGLWYEDYGDFRIMVDWLRDNRKDADRIGLQGYSFVKKKYGRNTVTQKWVNFVEKYIKSISA